MHSSSILLFSSVTILFVIFYHFKCEARDRIDNVTNPLIGSTGETLLSAGNIFELGFFTPEGNEKGNEYIGIWYYNMTPRTIVWVAKRDSPLTDSSPVFGIAEDGNLKLWYSNGGTSFPVTEFNPPMSFNRTLLLSDSGNLKLLDETGKTLWQSFDHPTDTFLPDMKMDDNMKLSSWLSPSDPATGNYVFQPYETVYRIQNRSSLFWTSRDPGLPMMPNYLPSVVFQMLSGLKTGNDTIKPKVTINYKYTKLPSNSSRLLMNSSGQIQYYVLDGVGGWSLKWYEPHDSCSVYEACGTFAICNTNNKSICNCLPGFKPVSMEDWNAGKYSEGCGRDITCKNMANKMEQNKFLDLGLMEVRGEFLPFNLAQNEDECQKECLTECKCNAYLFTEDNSTSRETGNNAAKCWISKSDLVNLKNDSYGSLRFNLSIRGPFQDTNTAPEPSAENLDRLDKEVHENKTSMKFVIVFITLVTGVVLVVCCCYVLYRRRMAKGEENQGNIEENPVLFICESEGRVNDLMDEKDKKGIDVPFYDFDAILSATDNFSDANKLGQGGFGPVYKGKFPGGQEIAVKRLSRCSGQGVKEFQNEVVLIAKLQHRNLVRLLGYCIKGNEKILLYEYMPNRSLDAFIFDQSNSLLLDWKKRFEIILGIARGLLYLHQDSRLRIVHRDLKTSNILLDEDMYPKISDFGLARIIEGKGTEASTNKVVGTFGYMSPEYALEGKFSTKSDVFSFGVLVLEIVSGKRNTGFYQPQEVLTLLGYAWRLWSENKALDLADPSVVVLDSCNKSQVMKCIHVGLLCVQEDPGDRPAMSNVVIMLESETSPLQPPTQPAFVVRRRHSSTSSTSSSKPDTAISNNELTISMVQGR